MNAPTLLPCPFCGEAEWIKRTHLIDGSGFPDKYQTGCWNCHASISADTQQIADAFWNRRQPCACSPDDENPEWTEEDFKRAEPAPSFLARHFGKGGKP